MHIRPAATALLSMPAYRYPCRVSVYGVRGCWFELTCMLDEAMWSAAASSGSVEECEDNTLIPERRLAAAQRT